MRRYRPARAAPAPTAGILDRLAGCSSTTCRRGRGAWHTLGGNGMLHICNKCGAEQCGGKSHTG
jgi:hypothetical protein